MSYQELYNVLNKRASNEPLMKLASMIRMIKTASPTIEHQKSHSANTSAASPLGGIRSSVTNAIKSPYAASAKQKQDPMKIFAEPQAKITPVYSKQDLDHPGISDRTKQYMRNQVFVTPPKGSTYLSNRDKLYKLMNKYKQMGDAQSWKDHFTINQRQWLE